MPKMFCRPFWFMGSSYLIYGCTIQQGTAPTVQDQNFLTRWLQVLLPTFRFILICKCHFFWFYKGYSVVPDILPFHLLIIMPIKFILIELDFKL